MYTYFWLSYSLGATSPNFRNFAKCVACFAKLSETFATLRSFVATLSPCQNLRFSSSFFWQWGRAVVGIVSAWRIANFILKEKFDLNIDDFVTYFEDGSIQINCGFDKDSHILLSQNNVFTISKECDQETWMKRMKGISDFHTEIHQKNGGVGDYWDDITEAKYCVDLYVLFVFNEQ